MRKERRRRMTRAGGAKKTEKAGGKDRYNISGLSKSSRHCIKWCFCEHDVTISIIMAWLWIVI